MTLREISDTVSELGKGKDHGSSTPTTVEGTVNERNRLIII
jgi:hypothetical protein